jgi:hypothetical protein
VAVHALRLFEAAKRNSTKLRIENRHITLSSATNFGLQRAGVVLSAHKYSNLFYGFYYNRYTVKTVAVQ